MKQKSIQNQSAKFLACLLFLLGFLLVMAFRVSFHSVDLAVNAWAPQIQSNTITLLAKAVAFVFDTNSLVIISLGISAALFLKNYKAHGLLLLGALGGEALLVSAIKTLDHVARPNGGIVGASGFSFPSGHSAASVVFGGVLAFFAWRY